MDLLAPLLGGLAITLGITVLTAILTFPFAVLVGIARISRVRLLRSSATIYVEIFRGTSLLVQIFYFYYVLPLFGLHLPALAAGVLALGLNVAAYGSEVVRGAINSVDRGQWEASIALNIPRTLALRRIILPQAAARMVLPFTNLTIELLKATSLLSLISIADLAQKGQFLVTQTARQTEIYLLVLVLYYIAAWPIPRLGKVLQRVLTRHLPQQHAI